MEKKLSDVLHMYLGCEVQFLYMKGTSQEQTATGLVWGITKGAAVGGTVMIVMPHKKFYEAPIEEIKPLLRPLSDMTEEEYDLWDNGIDGGLVQGTTDMIEQEAKKTLYLLKREFDLFGWIEAGLAIDKTKQSAQ